MLYQVILVLETTDKMGQMPLSNSMCALHAVNLWDLYLQVIRTKRGTMKRMTMSSLQKILELSIPLTHIRFYELYIP
jgi:hypothetical protein